MYKKELVFLLLIGLLVMSLGCSMEAKNYKSNSYVLYRTDSLTPDYKLLLETNGGKKEININSINKRQLVPTVNYDMYGHLWIAEEYEKEDTDSKANVFVLNNDGGILKTLSVERRPFIIDKGEELFITSRMDGRKGKIYTVSTKTFKITNTYDIDGYIWDIEKNGEYTYISSYIVQNDTAVIYLIKDKQIKKVDLGKSFSPIDLLYFKDNIYVSMYPTSFEGKKKIIQLTTKNLVKTNTFEVSIFPTKLFKYNDFVIIQEINWATGKSDKIMYLDPQSNKQDIYKLNGSYPVMKEDKDGLILLNIEDQSYGFWNYKDRRIEGVKKITKYTGFKGIEIEPFGRK